ncbi:MAG TPA: glycerophosphodiester phosphodiesterase [Gammaproteobacteria bacterium]|nr:glycerophosphodiester phosphodiesterase [Gammaproteobacteria bacterium]
MAEPIVIAHRGASGYLPEHTLEAKALAYGLGADFLEQDVVATRDGELVVLHDIHLDDVTDVAQRRPERRRADGHFYVVDFDLSELRELDVCERRRHGTTESVYPSRFPQGMKGLRIATLDEELELIRGLNRSTGRRVGVYPEIKEPDWHSRHGIDLGRLLFRKLDDHGYRTADDPVFVQCFDPAELHRARTALGSKLNLVQLVGRDRTGAELLTPDGLRRTAEFAQGLGSHYSQLVVPIAAARAGAPIDASPVVANAHAAGLRLHPYTFRRDDLPAYAASLEQMLEWFFDRIGVDGVFCDHPDVAVRTRDRSRIARVN